LLEKTSRRGFLGAMLAAAAAPAFIKSEVLMPVRKIIVPSQIVYEGGNHIETGNEIWNSADQWTMTTVNGIKLRNGDIITMAGVYAPDGSLQRLRVSPVTQHTYQLEAWR